MLRVAVVGDGDTADQLHHEVGPAGIAGAGVEHLRDGLVHHDRERLPLHVEPGDDLGGLEAGAENLERHAAVDGDALLGLVDHAHAAFPQDLENAVGTDGFGMACDDHRGLEGRVVKVVWGDTGSGGRKNCHTPRAPSTTPNHPIHHEGTKGSEDSVSRRGSPFRLLLAENRGRTLCG